MSQTLVATYSGRAVLTAVELVNSEGLGGEAELADVLTRHGWVLDGPMTARDAERLRGLGARLRPAFGSADVGATVELLNGLLAELKALPRLTDHDGAWHWHYAPPGAGLPERVGAACAAALLTVIAERGAHRLRGCEADGCRNVFVDASRNGSRRFCDSRTCGNRTHAAAYRTRRRDPADVS